MARYGMDKLAPLAYARCVVNCIGSVDVREAVAVVIVNLYRQSTPLTVFTLHARKTFGEKPLMRPARHIFRAGI
jgi:hypothetical protein